MGKQKTKRGNGSIHLRKDGRWEGRVVIGRNEKGLPKTKNVLAQTRRECQEKLKALRNSIKGAVPKQPKAGITFGAWLDHWYRSDCKPTISPKTQTDYENRIYQHIIPEIGHIPLTKLTSADLQQFYIRLKQGGRLLQPERYGPGLSDRMVKCCHVTCRAALDKAVSQGLLLKNPAAACKAPTTHPKEMQVLAQEEMQRLLIQAKEDGCYELLLLDLTTGLRRGELLALQWDDLDFQTGELRITRQVQRIRGELTITQPKTRSSSRSIILPKVILDILKNHRQCTGSRWMFPSPRKEDSPRDPAAVLVKNSNVSADLSGLLEDPADLDAWFREQSGYASLLRTWLAAAGCWDRLLYGSDWPIVGPEKYVSFIQRLVPPEHWEAVFFENAVRVYGLRGLSR